jgi:hypothetical protein
MQIYMQCDNGEIEVFLCPEDENASPSCSSNDDSSATDTESEASPMKPVLRRAPLPSPPPRLDLDEESRSSDIGQMRNVLISASEDYGPMGNHLQLQTLDQEHNGESIRLPYAHRIIMVKIKISRSSARVTELLLCCTSFRVYHSSSTAMLTETSPTSEKKKYRSCNVALNSEVDVGSRR